MVRRNSVQNLCYRIIHIVVLRVVLKKGAAVCKGLLWVFTYQGIPYKSNVMYCRLYLRSYTPHEHMVRRNSVHNLCYRIIHIVVLPVVLTFHSIG